MRIEMDDYSGHRSLAELTVVVCACSSVVGGLLRGRVGRRVGRVHVRARLHGPLLRQVYVALLSLLRKAKKIGNFSLEKLAGFPEFFSSVIERTLTIPENVFRNPFRAI